MITSYRASEILQVDVDPEGRLGVPHLNWRIRPRRLAPDRSAFGGAGLYMICFDGRLIYVGSYLGATVKTDDGKQTVSAKGDIVLDRWNRHVGSITGRSASLSVGATVLESLADLAANPMVGPLISARPAVCKDVGCTASERRLRFAAMHCEAFLGEPAEQLLQRFEFVYARIALPAHYDDERLEQAILDEETRLIRTLAPQVNTSKRPRGALPQRVTSSEAHELLRQALATLDRAVESGGEFDATAPTPAPVSEPRKKAVASASSLPDDATSEQRFHARISAEPSAIELVERVVACAGQLQAQVHYTATGSSDLRVSANRRGPGRRTRNVVTMTWQPRLQLFECGGYLSADECVQLGVPEAAAFERTDDPLPSCLKIRPGHDDEAWLQIVQESVRRFCGE